MDVTTYTVQSEATILEAVEVINASRVRCAIVTTDGKVVGVISEGDILRALLNGASVHSRLTPYVCHGFKFLLERDMGKARELVCQFGVSMIPILNEYFYLTDIVTIEDIMCCS